MMTIMSLSRISSWFITIFSNKNHKSPKFKQKSPKMKNERARMKEWTPCCLHSRSIFIRNFSYKVVNSLAFSSKLTCRKCFFLSILLILEWQSERRRDRARRRIWTWPSARCAGVFRWLGRRVFKNFIFKLLTNNYIDFNSKNDNFIKFQYEFSSAKTCT